MSELGKTQTIIFSQHKKKRKKRTQSEIIARNEDRDNSLKLARTSLENIMKFYAEFTTGYQTNNLYQLFKTSEGFYNNTIQFITIAYHLNKHKLIKRKDADFDIIVENMNILLQMIEQLNKDKFKWLSESTILDEPEFFEAAKEGTRRMEILKEKIQNFLDNIPKKIEGENEKSRSNQM